MKVYRVKLNVNEYQYLSPEDEGVWRTNTLTFDGTSKLAAWVPPAVFVYKPKRRRGNFFHLAPGCLCCDCAARDGVFDYLTNSGELLPLLCGSEEFSVLNVTECIEALDKARTQWREFGGVRTSIGKYAFHADRLPGRCLFKIPETARTEILTIEGRDDPLDEFKPTVEREGLTGLLFEEVWSDGQSLPI